MDMRMTLLLIAILMFVIVLGTYAVKFLKKENYILGLEWAIMASSGFNLLIWAITQNQWQWDLMLYLDAFSRAFGMTLFVIIGFFTATRNYRPTIATDVWLFLIAGIGTAVLLYVDALDQARPYIFFAVFYMFMPYLVAITYKLFTIGEKKTALHMGITTILLCYIHTIADFYKIPGDETNIVYNYGFMAFVVWGYGYSVLYHAYTALERHGDQTA